MDRGIQAQSLGSTGLQRPSISTLSGGHLHNHRHSETLSTYCAQALHQSRHKLAHLTVSPPGKAGAGTVTPTSQMGRLRLKAITPP